MKYSLNNPYLPYLADQIRTGDHDDGFAAEAYCSACGETIYAGEHYYDVGGSFYCMHCEQAAETAILNEVRDSYIYEV